VARGAVGLAACFLWLVVGGVGVRAWGLLVRTPATPRVGGDRKTTCVGAGDAAGGAVEALIAGSPVSHCVMSWAYLSKGRDTGVVSVALLTWGGESQEMRHPLGGSRVEITLDEWGEFPVSIVDPS